jgi:hypothetical protein
MNKEKNLKISKIKVIFLDIDGVLNHDKWYTSDTYKNMYQNENNELDLDPICVERINNICHKTNAKIVISSNWRISWYGTILRLTRGGLKEQYIIDKTPERMWVNIPNFDRSRGAEINDWLEQHNECENYIILDDRTDFKKEQLYHFIKINPNIGLTDEQMIKAIDMLNS